jgi:quercetin 2,3-dioxygenase
MFEGIFQHEDFAGNSGLIAPGDLQWMTAGRGIVHAEMPYSQATCKGLQLWVNLPKKAKMMEPRYQELKKEQVPVATSPSGGVRVKVIAGSSLGVDAKVHTYTPIYYLDVEMMGGEVFTQPVPANWTGFILMLQGDAAFGAERKSVPLHSAAVLSGEGNAFQAETLPNESARFVLIAGKPVCINKCSCSSHLILLMQESRLMSLLYSMDLLL